ncbi:methyl-accepting chemotaxis protein [Clostridium gelidum]|uniref:Methyl-accepting chemotaxis protein n=1 Tax=Clostridium gelidum TaxID=704125 RepID=A0ABM7SZB3_9CLOT|nr:methyl-accepting chemotaxis protein [Clostridium gelidum]BCZ44988.1 methyl-accepting chemotaxis protein [Clostridium gelidum]
MKKEQINSLIELMPYFNDLFNINTNIAVTDLNQFISIQQGDGAMNVNCKAGDPFNTNNPFFESIAKGKKTFSAFRDPDDTFIVPTCSTITSYYNNDNSIAGFILVVRDLEQQTNVQNLSLNISQTFSEFNKSFDNIIKEISKLSEEAHSNVQDADMLMQRINGIDIIIESIQNIANQSSLLALNAKIEAARAGEIGKGFGVVAAEIGKLSSSSKNSAEEAKKSLSAMKQAIGEINIRINSIESNTNNQVTSITNISKNVIDVHDNLSNLAQIAKLINN